MEPHEYLAILRRRWLVLVLTVLLGAAAGFASTRHQSSSGRAARAVTRFQGTALLVSDPTTGTNAGVVAPQQSLARLALFATTGDVPKLVAAQVGGAVIASSAPIVRQPTTGSNLAVPVTRTVTVGNTSVSATTDLTTGTLAISATDVRADRATKVANAFANELPLWLNAQDASQFQNRLNSLTAQRDAATDPRQVIAINGRINALIASGPSTSGLSVLQPAQIQTVSSSSSAGKTSATAKRSTRVLIGALVGLILGLGLVLVLERLDRRVRTVAAVEAAATLPVIAEIPVLSRRSRKAFRVVVASKPRSPIAESYRSLRTSLTQMWRANARRGRRGARDAVHGTVGEPRAAELAATVREPARVVLVTSAGAGEGKTTTAANLSASFGEIGRSVIVLDFDHHRPRLHRYLGASPAPDLLRLSTNGHRPDLDEVLQDTSISDVRFGAGADPSCSPAAAIIAERGAVERAKELADVVILDTPPLLVMNDASELLPHADAVVLVVRAGKTTYDAAVRASLLLQRLRAPATGIALIGGDPTRTHAGYDDFEGEYSTQRQAATGADGPNRVVAGDAPRAR